MTTHTIVCVPLASPVVSMTLNPIAPFELFNPGKRPAMSGRKLLYDTDPTDKPSTSAVIVAPFVGMVLGCGVSAQPKFT